MMSHHISIKAGSDYQNILSAIAQEDETVNAQELSQEQFDGEQKYQVLTITTLNEVSRDTERTVDCLSNVIVSTFNQEK